MNDRYRIIDINYVNNQKPRANILIIYMGGTLGMVHDESGTLVAFKFNRILKYVPSLVNLDIKITVISFPEPIDSSNVTINDWKNLGYIINENYHHYDGFVVLHGTDTMSFTASAISFMFQGLNKPIIFTGAQLPISAVRSDARANLVTALEIAAAYENGEPIVPEVCIYFDYQLLRANRSFKKRSAQFAAFGSENYPILAKAGISITYHRAVIKQYDPNEALVYSDKFDTSVNTLKIYPSINQEYVEHVFNTPGIKAVILESYGSGNAPTNKWFLESLKKACDSGILIYNVSQLIGGVVVHGRYETSKYLQDIGVVSGGDITFEAALSKMMFLLGNESDNILIRKKLSTSICGEMTVL